MVCRLVVILFIVVTCSPTHSIEPNQVFLPSPCPDPSETDPELPVPIQCQVFDGLEPVDQSEHVQPGTSLTQLVDLVVRIVISAPNFVFGI